MKKKISILLLSIFCALLLNGKFICSNCNHVCDDQCIYDETLNCISHDCINEVKPLEEKGPIG